MIIFNHALKRILAQPLNIFVIMIMPLPLIFIPSSDNIYPNGFYMYGLLSLFSAFLLCRSIVKERSNKIVQRISAAPISYASYLSGHLLAYVLILTVQAILFTLGLKLYYSDMNINFNMIFILFFTFNIMTISFCLFWNSLFRSYILSYSLFSGVASLMALASGITMPLAFLPNSIRNFSMFLPTYWLPYGLEVLYNNNTSYVLLSLIILLIYSGVFLLIGSRRRF
ncbi:MAG: ABC transporter permease [Clostridiales bacterium]|mgnify:CR=1 FL=1|nr:ABC transporter permease [Clostridiales bacterium]